MLYGEKFKIIKKTGDWWKIKLIEDKYIGFIKKKKFKKKITYYYKVSTINSSGTSVASPSGNAKTFGVPDAPTSLTATALIAIDIDLDWDAPTENNGAAVSGYKIERSTDDINYAVIVADTGNTDTDYTDTDAALVTDTTYYYRVSAINSFGAGATSNVAST